MKQLFLAALVAFAVAPCRAADAPPPEPVLVATFSGYDAWKSDLAYLGQLAEAPALADELEKQLTSSPRAAGLAGLDKSRPWGAALRTEGLHSVQLLVFLPVKDLPKLLPLFTAGQSAAKDEGDGVWSFELRHAPFYIKEHKGWAFVTSTRDALSQLPDNPLLWLEGLDKEYDAAFRLFPQHVRADVRPQIQEGLRTLLFLARMSQGDDGLPDPSRERITRIMMQQLDAAFAWLDEVESLTLGWALDAAGKQALVDYRMTPAAGSALEGRKRVPEDGSDFTSLTTLRGMLASLHVHSRLEPDDVAAWSKSLGALRAHVLEAIEADKDESSAEKAQVKTSVNELAEVLLATIQTGTLSGGAAVTGGGPLTIVGALRVEKPAHLETLLKRLATEAKGRWPRLGVTLDARVRDGLRYHGLTIPMSELDGDDEDRNESLRMFFGETLDVTVAFAENKFFWAIGPDGAGAIRNVRTGAALPPKLPIEATFAMQPLLQFLSRVEGTSGMLPFYANRLERTGLDKLRWTLEPEGAGFRARLHAEEGVVRVMALELNVKVTP